MRKNSLRLVMMLGLLVGVFTALPHPAGAAVAPASSTDGSITANWNDHDTAQRVENRCLDGQAVIVPQLVNHMNTDLSVVVTDEQTGKQVTFVAYKAGNTSPVVIIYTGRVQLAAGEVNFYRHDLSGKIGDDSPANYPRASYDAIDCRPAPNGTTSATISCNTTTGKYDVKVQLNNTGETDFRATSPELPITEPWIVRAHNSVQVDLTMPGSSTLSSYHMNLVNVEDNKTFQLVGTITPAMDGTCKPCLPNGPGETVFVSITGECVHVPIEGPPPAKPVVSTTTTSTTTPAATSAKPKELAMTGDGIAITTAIALGMAGVGEEMIRRSRRNKKS